MDIRYGAPIISLLRGAGKNLKNLIIGPTEHSCDSRIEEVAAAYGSAEEIFVETLILEDGCYLPDVAKLVEFERSNVRLNKLKILDVSTCSFARRDDPNGHTARAVHLILRQCIHSLKTLILGPWVTGNFASIL